MNQLIANESNSSLFDKIFDDVLKARIYNVCKRTSLDYLESLSSTRKNNIWIKREDTQPTHSFKIRGACCCFNACNDAILANGVVAASAGNHAQGVALAARHRGTPARIYMPTSTPSIKINSVKILGAEVKLVGNSLAETMKEALLDCERTGAMYLNGFDNRYVIAGQGTIGLEILQDSVNIPDAIFVPIGGGGLISGIAIVIKRLFPKVKIIGVEPVDSNAMTMSIKANKIVELDNLNNFAEGVAVARVGEIPFVCCQNLVDDYINVTSDEICFAIKLIHDNIRSIAEPSGAVGLAGLLSYINREKAENQNLVTINSGSNLDFERFRFISERTKIGAGREALFAIKLKEDRGSLKTFCQKILPGFRISEFSYRLYDAVNALVFLGIESSKAKDLEEINSRLNGNNYDFHDLTADELTKNHLKHMVGGRLPAADNNIVERVFQFQFQENEKALYNFVSKLSDSWNISLFHYRTYGIDYGNIFIGLQVHNDDSGALIKFLDSLNYNYTEETASPAYKLFLASA